MINNTNPLVSIILPIRNEAQFIRRSLGAVLCQDYPSDYMEVVVADGLSDDGTREIVREYQKKYLNLRVVDNPGRIVPIGMNAAIQEAKGDIFIRVDGHTIIASNYVRKCVDSLQKTEAENVGGRMNAVGNGVFGEAVALATSSPFGVGGARFHYSDNEEWVDTVYMGAWKRDVFQRIGLFDEELVRDQDDEFNYRLREHGGKILLSPNIKSHYAVRSNPRSLWKQYFQYGYWKVRVLQKHPLQMRPRQFVPPLFAASLLLASLFAITSPLFSVSNPLSLIPFSLVLVPYLLANLIASAYTASKKGWRHLPLLPVVFSILHLSYGFGFLDGLIKFWNRWGDKIGKVPNWNLKS